MSGEEILQAVGELAREKLGWRGAVRRDMRLVEDLELDSMRLLTLAMAVEDRFRVCLDESDEAGIATVGDLVGIVERKLAT
jgi:acyl carrier protein